MLVEILLGLVVILLVLILVLVRTVARQIEASAVMWSSNPRWATELQIKNLTERVEGIAREMIRTESSRNLDCWKSLDQSIQLDLIEQ